MRSLNENEMELYYGGSISWITVMCVCGGAAAIYKILFSGRGSVTIGPFNATWGR